MCEKKTMGNKWIPFFSISVIIIGINISRCNSEIDTLNYQETFWDLSNWVNYTGIIISVLVGVIESLGNLCIKKSHMLYEKYENNLEANNENPNVNSDKKFIIDIQKEEDKKKKENEKKEYEKRLPAFYTQAPPSNHYQREEGFNIQDKKQFAYAQNKEQVESELPTEILDSDNVNIDMNQNQNESMHTIKKKLHPMKKIRFLTNEKKVSFEEKSSHEEDKSKHNMIYLKSPINRISSEPYISSDKHNNNDNLNHPNDDTFRDSKMELEKHTSFNKNLQEDHLDKLRDRSNLYFYLGLCLISVLAPILNVFCISVLPASMVGFASVRITSALLLETTILKEKHSFYLYLGVPFSTVGLILIILYSSINNSFFGFEESFELFLKTESLILLFSEISISYTIIYVTYKTLHVKRKKMYNKENKEEIHFLFSFTPVIPGLLGSIGTILYKVMLTGFAPVFSKSYEIVLDVWTNTKLLGLAILTCSIVCTEIGFTLFILKHYRLSQVVALRSLGVVMFNSLNGMIILRERPSSFPEWLLGLFLVLIGILFLSYGNMIPILIHYVISYSRRSQ